jgi:chromosomal replication initiation ATPase DnaA
LFKALKLRGRTYVQIGQWLGGKDHSTVINGVKNAEKLMEDDPSYLQKVERLANLTHADCQRDYSFKVAA